MQLHLGTRRNQGGDFKETLPLWRPEERVLGFNGGQGKEH